MKSIAQPQRFQPKSVTWTPGQPIPKGHTARAWRALQAHAEEYEREQQRQRFAHRRTYRGGRKEAA